MNKEILNNSLTGTAFLKNKEKNITVDDMLDWRKKITTLMETKAYPEAWYKREIAAVDEIIKSLN